jgi:hypothetical protein
VPARKVSRETFYLIVRGREEQPPHALQPRAALALHITEPQRTGCRAHRRLKVQSAFA